MSNDGQHLQATRAKASAESIRIRRQRKHLKAELTQGGPPEGRHILADAIETMPDWLESADIWDVVEWAPKERGGYRREPFADQILATAGVRGSRQLRELTPRQREVIAGLLRTTTPTERKAAA